MKTVRNLLIVFLLFIILYLTGIINKILILCSSNIKYEWDASPTCQASFYNPLWACLECPPFLIVDISHNKAVYQGKTIRIFQNGNDLSKSGLSSEPRSFFICEGNIKESLSLLVWEFVEFRLEANSPYPVNGQYFDARICKFTQPTMQQKEYIESMLRFYGE